jgi:hypothetical protein
MSASKRVEKHSSGMVLLRSKPEMISRFGESTGFVEFNSLCNMFLCRAIELGRK